MKKKDAKRSSEKENLASLLGGLLSTYHMMSLSLSLIGHNECLLFPGWDFRETQVYLPSFMDICSKTMMDQYLMFHLLFAGP